MFHVHIHINECGRARYRDRTETSQPDRVSNLFCFLSAIVRSSVHRRSRHISNMLLVAWWWLVVLAMADYANYRFRPARKRQNHEKLKQNKIQFFCFEILRLFFSPSPADGWTEERKKNSSPDISADWLDVLLLHHHLLRRWPRLSTGIKLVTLNLNKCAGFR